MMDNSWRIGWRFSAEHMFQRHLRIGCGIAIRPLAWVLGFGIDVSDGWREREFRIIIGIGPFHFGPTLTLPLESVIENVEDD